MKSTQCRIKDGYWNKLVRIDEKWEKEVKLLNFMRKSFTSTDKPIGKYIKNNQTWIHRKNKKKLRKSRKRHRRPIQMLALQQSIDKSTWSVKSYSYSTPQHPAISQAWIQFINNSPGKSQIAFHQLVIEYLKQRNTKHAAIQHYTRCVKV